MFTGGEWPGPETVRRVLENGAGDALIAAADSGLILAEAAGLVPDWIVGDMDSLAERGGEGRLGRYPAERIIRHPADKDYTDTELALALLREKGCGETWIIGGGGGKAGHFFGIRELFEGDGFPARWVTAAEDIYCIEGNGGRPQALALGVAPGTGVSVCPLGGGPWQVKSAGLKWPLDNVSWKRGIVGLSNVALTGAFEINVQQGRFMIILEDIWQR